MSDIVTNEEDTLTAWQRWELPAFESGRDSVRANLPTAVELEQMQQQAREEASQAGYAEGQQRGYADGLQQATQQNQQLLELANVLTHKVDDLAVQELTGLALDVARQVIQQAVKVQPELLQAAVREAINTLPVFNQAAHVILNPQDAAMVRERMGDQLSHTGWKILEDVRMERGDARLETANSQVDVTLATRWERVVAAMGQDAPWLVKTEDS
ncbi:MAG: flagellar assembly protein FliH [Gammaproteobacteria bacterium]|nr:flagellar assembly protein FliH [Gammaproteobacteria bacterium]MBU1623789.1 flagellar assembly protein FliH [Gammaproteobacteria bacterium]MBU1982006.1 flagellar assembly protein FliH [Gammaproteobacteria bacterium]